MYKKIYFCGSIKGGRQDREVYEKLIRHLSKYAHVLTEHIADPATGIDQHLTDKEIHDRDVSWLRSADLVVAEVTQPSLGVGYELGRALEWGKRLIVLFREGEAKRLSAMIAGAEGMEVYRYQTVEEAMEILDRVLEG